VSSAPVHLELHDVLAVENPAGEKPSVLAPAFDMDLEVDVDIDMEVDCDVDVDIEADVATDTDVDEDSETCTVYVNTYTGDFFDPKPYSLLPPTTMTVFPPPTI
jgi:hypothetical protein